MSTLRHRFTPGRYQPVDERRPPPSHRHAQPSAPWPWVNIHDEVDAVQLASPLPPVPPKCDHSDCGGCWRGYPQSRFPNWTRSQVKRSGIYAGIHDYQRDRSCIIHSMDVDNKGLFKDADRILINEDDQENFWYRLITTTYPSDNRVRALFVENMSGPVLQMLGAKFNIEPFFFSSSLSWIPSRFQEEVRPDEGDHITITLTFVRPIDSTLASESSHSISSRASRANLADQVIDTQAPLYISSGEDCYLVLDLLAVHLIRSTSESTIISFHPSDSKATSAPYLHERIRFAGQSVYWQSIFQKSSDPTFVLLTFMWLAMYASDEALERLYSHICWLETQVITTSNLVITRELHIIRAHLLHYSSLLEDFRKSIIFILNTPNPAMDALSDDEKKFSRKLLEKECNNLLIEVDRLEMSRRMQDKRLKNVMNLVFSSVNIGDSKRMQQLTEAALKDSAAMKQIAYLSMIFLPASFVAAVFGMNVQEIVPDTHGTLPHYVETAVPFTMLTIWIVMTFQSQYLFRNQKPTFWMRLAWPVLVFRHWRHGGKAKQEKDNMMLVDWES